MFTLRVDQEIELALLQPSFAPLYTTLLQENYADLSQWLTWPATCKTEEDFLFFIQHSLHDYADRRSMVCAILYQKKLVGDINFNAIDYQQKQVEIGYWLAISARKKGVVTRACHAMMNLAFNEWGMCKVIMRVATHNHASLAVCQRLGMILEDTVYQAETVNGDVVDYAIYSAYSPLN